jgi:hypothetical protein
VIPRGRASRALWITIASAVVGASAGVALIFAIKRHPTAEASTSPLPSASVAASASPAASEGAPPVPSAALPEPSAPPSTAPTSDVPRTAHFPALHAKQALDTAAHAISHCKHGKVWGIASANVTFEGDGAVSKVAVGVPFTGTPTGTCVSDALSTAHVPPFAGKPVILNYKFFVPPR